MERTSKSVKNLAFAVGGQVIGLLISFFSRMVFVKTLGESYLGLNSLFANILSVLSLAELGFGSAIIYSLYKPLAENDELKVAETINLYGFIHKVVGIIVLVFGIILSFFINVFIKNDAASDAFTKGEIRLYFLLFLSSSVISYFLAYKRSLLIADQKRYIATLYRYAFYSLLNIVQIIILFLTKNYILYLSLQIISTFFENLAVTIKANRMYPYLRKHRKEKLSKTERQPIFKNVKALLFHKVGGVASSGSTSLILSSFVGLSAVALYSNYLLIVTALTMIIGQLFESATASVGNLNAEKGGTNSMNLFYKILFAGSWIAGFTSSSFFALATPFISLWLGKNFSLPWETVLIISLSFLYAGMRKPTLMFKDALGIFYPDRLKPLFEAVVGISLAILLSFPLGTFGTLLGFLIGSVIACTFIEPYVLYKYGFNTRTNGYFKKFIPYLALNLVAMCATYFVVSLVPSGALYLILKFVVAIIFPNLLFFLIFRKTDEFRYFLNMFKALARKLKEKLRKRIV